MAFPNYSMGLYCLQIEYFLLSQTSLFLIQIFLPTLTLFFLRSKLHYCCCWFYHAAEFFFLLSILALQLFTFSVFLISTFCFWLENLTGLWICPRNYYLFYSKLNLPCFIFSSSRVLSHFSFETLTLEVFFRLPVNSSYNFISSDHFYRF